MLGYPNQRPITAFSSEALTGTYSNSAFEFDCGGFSKLTLDFDYAMGATESANTLSFKLEHSPDDGTTWYSLVIDETGATSVITPRVWVLTGTAKVDVVVDIAYTKLKLSMIEGGVITNAGTATVEILLSGI